MEKRAEVTGSLVTVGDEILLGDIPNGNSHHIASELRSKGFRLDRIVTVGDREDEIAEILEKCVSRSQFLIVTGGLGPTEDDRTCSAASRAFGRAQVTDEDYCQWLRGRAAERRLAWSDELARLAELPEGAVKIGLEMAGFFLEHEGVPCYFLPGVPGEMRMLLSEMVIPDLEERFPGRYVYLKQVVRVQGLFESEIGRRLRELDCRHMGVEIGYLPQGRENWVTLFARGASEDECRRQLAEACRKVVDLIGAHNVSGYGDDVLEKVVGRLLRQSGWRMAVAESCTGGLLSARVTSVPGASDYFDRGFVTYSNRAKTDLLDVPGELIEVHGAVSEPVALEMARGARVRAGAEVAAAVTGIAGPGGGSPVKPVGTVYIACVTPRVETVEKHLFSGNREDIRGSAVHTALQILWRCLTDDSHIHCH